MGPSGFPVIIESQAIMVSTRVAIGKLNHALEVWSDGPRLPNIEPLQHEPSTADSTAIQPCIGQYSARSLCTRGVVLYCNTALYILQLYSALHSTALYNPPQRTLCTPADHDRLSGEPEVDFSTSDSAHGTYSS